MKCLILRCQTLTVLACALLATTMFAPVNAPAVTEASATDRQLPIYCVRRNQKMLTISFDAAWDNEDTQQFIDILGKYSVKTTFFMVGSWVDKYPESAKTLHDAGHEAMNHSNSHAHMSQLSNEAVVADVKTCNDEVEVVTGVCPTLIRPPCGEYDNSIITSIRSIEVGPIQWDVDSLDQKGLPAREITERVVSRIQPRSVVFFHNAALHTPEVLPAILETLLQEGYTFVPISGLILSGEYSMDYTIDYTGR